ncbi:MAG TPA: RodZ domain-containing protein [Candidatus Limnocylindria bacterium]|nr:RodZ domain-containing protein [Candidatus Limnocylindria bacterium]
MSTAPFGEHLKREREMRGVSLEEISAATRISTRFLEALENDHWDQLPGGVFNRGFIRSIARFLGLDEESLVAEYALETKNRTDAGVIPDPPMEMRRNWGPAIVAFGMLAAIVVGGWFIYAHYGAQIAARLHKLRPALAVSTTAPSAAPNVASAHAPDVTPMAPTVGDPTLAAATLPRAALELKIEAGKPADLKVVADGRPVYDGHVEPGNVMRFDARDSLEISTSESSALLLELNGQTVAPIGLPGQSGSVTLTQKDLKPTAGGPH